jgi:NAD(P)H dehydrogenase (quinone)
MGPVKAAIIYYSATGTVHALAQAAAEGAQQAGAEVRLRRVPELAPPSAISANPAWQEHHEASSNIALATLDDLGWADVVLIGAPTRFGVPASQLTAFLDTTGPLWQEGRLANKVCSAFTSAGTLHGGHESTLLALDHVFTHWGGIIVPPGYTDPVQYQTGNPYGTSHVAAEGLPGDVVLEGARHQARRAVAVSAALKGGSSFQGEYELASSGSA